MLSAVAGVQDGTSGAGDVEQQRRIRRRLRAEAQHFVVARALTLAREAGRRVPDERIEPVDRARELRDRLGPAIVPLDVRQLVHQRRLPGFDVHAIADGGIITIDFERSRRRAGCHRGQRLADLDGPLQAKPLAITRASFDPDFRGRPRSSPHRHAAQTQQNTNQSQQRNQFQGSNGSKCSKGIVRLGANGSGFDELGARTRNRIQNDALGTSGTSGTIGTVESSVRAARGTARAAPRRSRDVPDQMARRRRGAAEQRRDAARRRAGWPMSERAVRVPLPPFLSCAIDQRRQPRQLLVRQRSRIHQRGRGLRRPSHRKTF